MALAYRTRDAAAAALRSGPKYQIELGWLHMALLLGNLTVVSIVVIQGYLLPLSSWDALGAWSQVPYRYIQLDAFGEIIDGVSRESGAAFPRAHPRHPMTLFNVIAFSRFYMAKDAAAGWIVPWVVAWLCGVSIIFGWTLAVTRSVLGAGISCYVFCTIPLLENHASFALGYADLWITLSILASTAIASLGFLVRCNRLVLFGGVLAIIPILLKNIGPLITVVLVVTSAFIALMSARTGRATTLVFVLVSAGVFFGAPELIKLISSQYSDSTVQLSFGGWQFESEIYPWFLLLRNHVWAIFVNQSFSVCGVATLFFLGWSLLSTRQMKQARKHLCGVHLLITGASLWFLFAIPQFLTDFSLAYAIPGNDTGSSRFLLYATPVLLMMTVIFVSDYVDTSTGLQHNLTLRSRKEDEDEDPQTKQSINGSSI